MIKKGTILDVENYEQIYEQYLSTLALNSTDDDVDYQEMINKVKKQKRAWHVLNSEKYLVALFRTEDCICGFMEAAIVENDYMFEKEHIYISNLYIDKEMADNINTTKFLFEMYQTVLTWCKEHNVNYICDDINVGNKIMEALNDKLGFKPYKTRYYKKI
jgi:hypothetical protein